MKNKLITALFMLASLEFICWSLLSFKKDFFPTKQFIEYREQQKDSIEKELLFVGEEIEMNTKIGDSLKQHLTKKDTRLGILKKEQDEKVNYIKGTTDLELLEFFSKFNSKSVVN